MVAKMDENRLSVAGASLFYRVQGNGPPLLFMQGGDGDADGCQALVKALAETYSVITYDPRGLSRSPIDMDVVPDELRVEVHGGDAHQLLAALTDKPALVFGTSRGALVGLDLVTRYGAQVKMLVAHEPPLNQLLSEAERAEGQAERKKIEAAMAGGGGSAAMQQFFAMLQLDFTDHEEGFVMPAPAPGRATNFSFFLAHDAPAIEKYHLDMVALKRTSAHIVPAVGASSRARFPGRCAMPLARELGETLVEFPGGHNGPITHPRAFASRLREVFAVTESGAGNG